MQRVENQAEGIDHADARLNESELGDAEAGDLLR
jgi:hypothetical protein